MKGWVCLKTNKGFSSDTFARGDMSEYSLLRLKKKIYIIVFQNRHTITFEMQGDIDTLEKS